MPNRCCQTKLIDSTDIFLTNRRSTTNWVKRKYFLPMWQSAALHRRRYGKSAPSAAGATCAPAAVAVAAAVTALTTGDRQTVKVIASVTTTAAATEAAAAAASIYSISSCSSNGSSRYNIGSCSIEHYSSSKQLVTWPSVQQACSNQTA